MSPPKWLLLLNRPTIFIATRSTVSPLRPHRLLFLDHILVLHLLSRVKLTQVLALLLFNCLSIQLLELGSCQYDDLVPVLRRKSHDRVAFKVQRVEVLESHEYW